VERLLFRPFGPSIAKVRIPNEILNYLNKYTESKLNENLEEKKINAGDKLAGNVSQEIIINDEAMKESGFSDFLMKECANWIYSYNKQKITKFDLIASWIVRQFQNEYNPLHMHNGHVSGVGYLKLPTVLGNTKQKNKPNKNGDLQLVHGSKTFLSESIFNIKPKVGDFYFFPHYLMHVVYPFCDTDEERRSVSFNAYVDHEIYASTD